MQREKRDIKITLRSLRFKNIQPLKDFLTILMSEPIRSNFMNLKLQSDISSIYGLFQSS